MIHSKVIFGIIAIVIFIFIMFPIVWLVITSFKSNDEIYLKPALWFSKNPSVKAYKSVLLGTGLGHEKGLFLRQIGNSFIVSSITALITIFLATLAAYAFGRLKFPFRIPLFISFVVAQLIPGPLVFVPIFSIMKTFGFRDHLFGLIIVYVAASLPIAILISTGCIRQIPAEIEEAALVDGCTRFSALLRVILPLSKMPIITAGVFSFLISFSEYPIALILMDTPTKYTFPLGLGFFVTEFGPRWSDISAGATAVMIPVIVIFLLVQKHFVKGLLAGSIKG
ncbi:carbohydrate ABC transporter permease [bacterium]|nr:carbohydrate ABC transporter permease [bacterium]